VKCPICGNAEMAEEKFYRCPSCGDDYTGGLAALVLDAHTAALRSENDRLRGEVEEIASDYQDIGAKLHAAEAALSEAREVLRSVEWKSGAYREDARCPVCFGLQPDAMFPEDPAGHLPGCRLARLLAPPPEATP
jgi:hypothetical protein